jgi:hypothetical protein
MANRMKPAYQSTEFWLVPAAWAAMEASPEIAWPIAVAYVAFALGRSLVKALAGEEVQL